MAWYKQAPKQPMTGKQKLAGTVGAAAAALLIGTVAMWEGVNTKPHWDNIGKVWDVCYGDTAIELREYTEEECRDTLARRLTDYAKPVLKRNPELAGHDPQLVAATSLAYNIGVGSYNRSTVAKRFSAGNWRGACDAFLSWSYAKGKQIRGLLNRRKAEREICLRGLPS